MTVVLPCKQLGSRTDQLGRLLFLAFRSRLDLRNVPECRRHFCFVVRTQHALREAIYNSSTLWHELLRCSLNRNQK